MASTSSSTSSSAAALLGPEVLLLTQAEEAKLLMDDSLFMPPPSQQSSAVTAVTHPVPSSSADSLLDSGSDKKGKSKNMLSPYLIDSPRPMDVLLGRGGKYKFHPGNTRLEILVGINQKRYDESKTRAEKTRVTEDMVNQIKNCGTERGRFLKPDYIARGWREVSDEVARQKCSNSLRYARNARKADMKSSGVNGSVPKRSFSTTAIPENLVRPGMTIATMDNGKRRRTSEYLVSNEEILCAIGYGDFENNL